MVRSPVPVIAPVTSIPAPISKFPLTSTVPSEAILNLVNEFVWSLILKTPLPFTIAKSESLFVSVRNILGTVDVIVRSPVVVIFPAKVDVPALSIVNLVVGEPAPSAAVLNTKRPGVSLAPGVPSILACISAA